MYQTYFFINLPFLGRAVFECAVCRRSPQRRVASLASRSGELMSCRASTIISSEHQRGERIALHCALKSPTFKGQYAVTLKEIKTFYVKLSWCYFHLGQSQMTLDVSPAHFIARGNRLVNKGGERVAFPGGPPSVTDGPAADTEPWVSKKTWAVSESSHSSLLTA